MSAKQPRKKRRLDPEEGSSTNVPPELVPLVMPNQVPKSSKDPNRGMYPRTRASTSSSTATFIKASELIKSSRSKSEKIATIVISDSENSDLDMNQSAHRISKRTRKSHTPSKPKYDKKPPQFPETAETVSTSSRSHKHKASECDSATSKKILDYFKTLPGSGTKKHSPVSDNIPGTSTSPNIIPEAVKRKNEAFFEKFRNCHYGLLGDVSSDECVDDRPNYFEKLPDHIMETILCQIPMLDLLKYRLVCKVWNDVITCSKFMDWKLLYYQIKMKKTRALNQLNSITSSLGLKTVEDAFPTLIRYMGEKYNRKPSKDMYDLLVKNELAITAELVLLERYPDLCNRDSKPWSILAMAILLSETVWDIHGLYKSLVSQKSNCSLHDVTNALYCAATFLLYFRNTLHLNYGLHYRVYYVLYMIENTLPSKRVSGTQSLKVPKGLPGQQSIHSFCNSENSILTYEQLRILNHCIQPKQRVKIVALAGTGKTTTLIHLARLYPQVKFLNVVYNKAICEDVRKRFPPNVTCKTAHSLAYAVEGSRMRYKLTTKIKPHDIVTLLQHKEGSNLHVYSYAKHVLSTIESYICSADEDISMDHVPILEPNSKVIREEDRIKLMKDTKQLWLKMINCSDRTVKITHDVYLKLYQLGKPNLSQYQCIMVDEAQDSNPAMLSVMLSQNLPVILVGDPNQQIYGFRGAKNALQNIDATHTYHLTKSFRFGPEISYIASSCLESLKHITTQTLVGNEKPSYVNGKTQGQYAIIARSNVMLFNEAVRLCCKDHQRRDHEPSIINAAFVGGIEGYGFQQLLDICKLANLHNEPGYIIKDKFISKFKSFEDLTNYAKNADDSDLKAKVEIIGMYGSEIPTYIKTLKEKCSHPLQLANVVFSTAHKAKGLEFDTVCLTDDYPIVNWGNIRRRGSITQGSEEEEYNVIYVALTRAKKCLLLPEKLYRVLLSANEKFEYPVPSADVLKNDDEIQCIICSERFTPHTVLALVRREIILANGRKVAGGAMCMKCRTDPKVRTRVELEPVIMYLDPTEDYAHRSMASLVGPLPNDPPIAHNTFPPFQDMDVFNPGFFEARLNRFVHFQEQFHRFIEDQEFEL